MRPFLLALLLACSPYILRAERNKLTPADFEPLTTAPWLKPGTTLEGVLDAIFREPDINIRYPVLAAYLDTIPVADLGKALDRCVILEGKQRPNELVSFFLEIWAGRDPEACWARTRQLFRLVGIEDDWLGYDSWSKEKRNAITVRDPAAFRASAFWLTSDALRGFPLGVSHSSHPAEKRARILKEFLDHWLDAYGTAGTAELWPGYDRPAHLRGWDAGYPSYFEPVLEALRQSDVEHFDHADGFKPGMLSGLEGIESYERAASEIKLRQWVLAKPNYAPQIVKVARETLWPPQPGFTNKEPAGPSLALLTIWAKADQPGLLRWADSLDMRTDKLAGFARGFLMSRVDAATRQRWLAEAKIADKKMAGDQDQSRIALTAQLMGEWAKWDPKAALAFAADARDVDLLTEAANSATSWPACNMWHSGLGAIKDFALFDAQLPKAARDELVSDWSQMVLEAWGEVDIGESARYGLDFLLRSDYVPREGLIRFFSGEDLYPDEGGAIDRTFCALRVWAVFKPAEMKTWIATLKDPEMRKALTWLLDHPRGGAEVISNQ